MSDVEAKNTSGAVTAALHGQTAAITAGGAGTSGSVEISDAKGKRTVLVTTGTAPVRADQPIPGDPTRSPNRPPQTIEVWKAPPERITSVAGPT